MTKQLMTLNILVKIKETITVSGKAQTDVATAAFELSSVVMAFATSIFIFNDLRHMAGTIHLHWFHYQSCHYR